MHSEVIAEVYRGCGGLLRKPPAPLEPAVSQYKELLQKAGKEVVENQRLSEEIVSELEKPIVSAEQFIAVANEYIDELLS